MTSNGVPPPPPNVALSFGAITAVSDSAVSVVDGAVSADNGMVVTDCISGSDRGADVVKVAEVAPGGPSDIDVVDEEAVLSEFPTKLSLVWSGTLLGLRFDVTVAVGCSSIPPAASDPVNSRALGHMAAVPSEIKNKPISVSSVALAP